ncbi:MAG: UDP-2,3-diacylglucosamine diphosphatase [Paludibacteraceae bacterium]|nr:UDP-2,3-diacylglucosamine diphosphatase [Paludibacteraceae bacterium]
MIYFLSDAHIGSRALGDRAAHEKHVCQCLLSLSSDATAVYLLGDWFDYWYEYVWRKPQEYSLTLATLRQLTGRGIPVHYFIGNHDIWTFGWLEEQTGVILHRRPEVMTIAGKQCLLAHGDGLIPSDMLSRYPKPVQKKIRRFMFLRWVFHNPVLQRLFALVPPDLGDRLGYEWARRSRLKELAHPVGYKGENEEELVLYAKEQEQKRHLDYYIFGHRHIELDLCLASDARVVILGDMFRQFTYAAMDNNGNLTLENYEEYKVQ